MKSVVFQNTCRLQIVVCCLVVTLNSVNADERNSTTEINFQRQIQPILAEYCTHCHGADAQSRQAGLRLDVDQHAYQGGESGVPAISPGNANQSLVLERVQTKDPGEVMPPPHTNKALSESEIALLRQWIDQGAKYEAHWAFSQPRKPSVSSEDDKQVATNPIDVLVKQKLKQEGLQMANRAPRHMLARRIYLDLLGVPPSPTQVVLFEQESIEATIDRLLSSDNYGEKWARHWLDVARYSDSNGYEKDMRREQWAWRDWVINAFNRDVPYDQFIIEQVAGDLLPNPTQDQIVATGFLRNSMINEEGAIIPEQFRMAEMFDRIDCIGKATLGLTTQCAQCHTHKFDPITHDEYFGMFAYLNNSYEAQSAVFTSAQQDTIRTIKESAANLESQAKQKVPNWEIEQQAWVASIQSQNPEWKAVHFDDMNSVSGLNHPVHQVDGSILMTGHRSDEVYMIGSPELDGVTGLQLEVLTHGDLPLRGPGRNATGQWQIHSLDCFIKKPESKDWEEIKVASATADFSSADRKSADDKQTFGSVAHLFDDKPETFWESNRGNGLRNQPSVAVLAFELPLSAPAGTRFKLTMNMADNVGCCRVNLTKTPQPKATSFDHAAWLASTISPEQRSSDDQSTLFRAWCKSHSELQEIHSQIDTLLATMPQPSTSVLHLAEREPKVARQTYLLDRGEWDKPKHVIEPHVPSSLHPMLPSEDAPRLAFAKWLVDKRSSLAARVAVNRIWQTIWGDGLVATSEDFGTRTPIPEQSELLDFLAVEFMENGWSQKRLLKLILTSQTYQQSSALRPELAEKDPRNKLLGRGPRFRTDAEVVRDMALSIAGLLSPKIGGPSTIPPVPKNVLDLNFVVPDFWTPAMGSERYRRAMYVFRKRSMPDPVMSSLDAPNGDFSCARRVRSNTPLAALTMLNEPIFIEAAQAMSLRVLKEGGADDNSRIDYAFRLCIARSPKEVEKLAIQALLAENRTRLADGWLNSREIATSDPSKLPELPEGTTPQDAAAWTLACRVLLNLDETISKN